MGAWRTPPRALSPDWGWYIPISVNFAEHRFKRGMEDVKARAISENVNDCSSQPPCTTYAPLPSFSPQASTSVDTVTFADDQLPFPGDIIGTSRLISQRKTHMTQLSFTL
ncbi:uncharacterized protein LOC142774765 [Rhipicephalus microplus]|uniref:uncharacterized protein LOC142774765 n=1 Tax=Rhipicephalus microplus TaxID=6941 RepID=UPI003F6C47B1